VTRIVGVLLAAGAGRRMGGPKALVEGVDGLPWVVTASRALSAGGCDEVVVVLGAGAVQAGLLLTDEPVRTVVAGDWASGLASSLRAGLTAASATGAEAALVHLVDLPDVGSAVVRRVADRAAADVLARASYAAGPGHPVLLGRSHWAAVMTASDGDRGAATYLARHDVELVDCADLATGVDHDTPEVDARAQHPR
jgi:molybdenum cofactor cytidylyltransferase/nicotine blue oxidoreductase